MLKALKDNDELINVRASDKGAIKVEIQNGSSQETKLETTLNASIQTIGTQTTTISLNKKVTEIDIANFSDSANVIVGVGTLNATIGANIATTLKINRDVADISLTSTEDGTRVQIIVKGEE